MSEAIRVVRSGEQADWTALVDPPGSAGTGGTEQQVFADGRFTTGLWRRDPDTWSFERPYHEVAMILEGAADIEEPNGTVHTVGAGDVLVTPKESRGTWRIRETIVKFYAIVEVD